jgi:type VI protein secretion system component Hcp
MAMMAYMYVKGQKQGSMKGGITQKGRENSIGISGSEVISISHGTLTPRDPNSGLASGKRQHQPVTITKEVDATSPKLLQALWSNEALDITVGVSGNPSPPGITLKDGTIVEIRPYFGPAPWGHLGKRYEDIVVAFPELSSFELQYLAQLSQGA